MLRLKSNPEGDLLALTYAEYFSGKSLKIPYLAKLARLNPWVGKTARHLSRTLRTQFCEKTVLHFSMFFICKKTNNNLRLFVYTAYSKHISLTGRWPYCPLL